MVTGPGGIQPYGDTPRTQSAITIENGHIKVNISKNWLEKIVDYLAQKFFGSKPTKEMRLTRDCIVIKDSHNKERILAVVDKAFAREAKLERKIAANPSSVPVSIESLKKEGISKGDIIKVLEKLSGSTAHSLALLEKAGIPREILDQAFSKPTPLTHLSVEGLRKAGVSDDSIIKALEYILPRGGLSVKSLKEAGLSDQILCSAAKSTELDREKKFQPPKGSKEEPTFVAVSNSKGEILDVLTDDQLSTAFLDCSVVEKYTKLDDLSFMDSYINGALKPEEVLYKEKQMELLFRNIEFMNPIEFKAFKDKLEKLESSLYSALGALSVIKTTPNASLQDKYDYITSLLEAVKAFESSRSAG
jgi:hypothetical protein